MRRTRTPPSAATADEWCGLLDILTLPEATSEQILSRTVELVPSFCRCSSAEDDGAYCARIVATKSSERVTFQSSTFDETTQLIRTVEVPLKEKESDSLASKITIDVFSSQQSEADQQNNDTIRKVAIFVGRVLDGKDVERELFFDTCQNMLIKINCRDKTIVTVNQAFTATFGWTTDGLRGRTLRSVADPQSENDHFEQIFNSVDTNGRNPQVAFPCKDSGSHLWVGFSYFRKVEDDQFMILVLSRVFTTSSDAKMKSDVRPYEKYLLKTLSTAKVGQWELDVRTNELRCSDVVLDIHQIDRQQPNVSMEMVSNNIHPDDREFCNSKFLSALVSQEPYEITTRLLLPDNTVKWVLSHSRLEHDENGEATHWVGTCQDITELKTVQNDLMAAKQKAEESDRLKTAFLANMSHEIRTPLNAVLGFTNLMLSDSEQICPEHMDYLETINNSGNILLALINDILDVSKIEAGQFELDQHEFSLGKILGMVEQNGRGLISRKGDRIEFVGPALDGSKPVVGDCDLLFGDAIRLQQVLNNLISNSIKFTASGYVKYSVEIISEGSTSMLRFTVEDSGVGIPACTHEKIFEPFRQAHRHDDPVTSILGGTGLGLTIAKKLVNKMGGDIALESHTEGEKRGTVVQFTIPYKPVAPHPSNDTAQKQVASLGHASVTRLQGKVLLVDDNKINLKLTKRIVERLGLECDTAENGKIAVDMYLENKAVDVILMDKEMPVMNGLEAMREIRAEETKAATKKRVPIIALTAAAMKADRDACFSAGCDEYLPKPVNQKKLSTLLAKYTTVLEGQL